MNWCALSLPLLLLISLSHCHPYPGTPELQQHSTKLDYLRTVNKTIDNVLKGNFNLKCSACEVFVEVLQVLVQTNTSEEEIVSVIASACVALEIEDTRVCWYIINEFREEFISVGANLLLHPSWLCYAAIGKECGEPPDIFPFWNVTVPGGKPTPKPLVRPQEGLPTLRVVQLSDVHIDLQYLPGAVKNCGEPLCCREGDGMANTTDNSAGFWGSLECDCDLPLRTFSNALQFIAEEIKPDVVFWTGDIPAHNVWNQTRAAQLHHILLTSDIISHYLPHTQVYPSLGNHESAPVDSFPPPGRTPDDLSNKWLNEFIEKVWSRWLPPLPTIGYAGYYAVQYSQKLRVVSLNTQYCDEMNFWLYLNNTDPGDQLSWLVDNLAYCERYDIKVIVLGHIPSGKSDCLKAFSWNYYKIVDRFESTIVGQYVGHTHQDEYKMFYSEEADHHPTGFQFVSPSLTTYSNMKPSIRVYTLDGNHENSTYRPLDSQTWVLDLDRANEKNETVWELEYSASKAYNLTWLTPDTMQSLYERFVGDKQFFIDTYFKYQFHSRPNDTCSDDDYKYNMCLIKTGRSHDPTICPDMSLETQYKLHAENNMC